MDVDREIGLGDDSRRRAGDNCESKEGTLQWLDLGISPSTNSAFTFSSQKAASLTGEFPAGLCCPASSARKTRRVACSRLFLRRPHTAALLIHPRSPQTRSRSLWIIDTP